MQPSGVDSVNPTLNYRETKVTVAREWLVFFALIIIRHPAAIGSKANGCRLKRHSSECIAESSEAIKQGGLGVRSNLNPSNQ